MNLKGIDNVNTWHIVHAFSQNDRRERGNRARVIRNKTISNYKKILGQSILIEFQNGGTEKHGFYSKVKHDHNVKGVMRFIVPVIYKHSPYTAVITAEVFGSEISFNKTPATLYEIFDRKIKTARPDYANLKSSGLGEKSPINYTLLEILGKVKDLSGIPYVVNGHLNYYLLNEGKGNYFQNGGKYKGGYSPESNAIHLFSAADQSTMVHEAAHFYLTTLLNLEQAGVKNKQLMSDLKIIRDWAGYSYEKMAEYKGTTLEREFQQKEAEPLIQKYLDEGMLPAHAVDKVLKETDFKAYMTKAVKDAMLSSAVICCHLLSLVPALTLRGNLRHWMKRGTRQG